MTSETDTMSATIEPSNKTISTTAENALLEEGGTSPICDDANVTNIDEHESEAQPSPSMRSKATKLLFGLAFVAFVVYVIVDSSTNMHFINAIEDFLEWVEANPVGGVFAFVVGTWSFSLSYVAFLHHLVLFPSLKKTKRLTYCFTFPLAIFIFQSISLQRCCSYLGLF